MTEKTGTFTVTIDDDPVVASLIETILGLPTINFPNAEGLTKRLAGSEPLAFFVDIHLAQQACGLDIIPDLVELFPRTPVIVMTSDPDQRLVMQALAVGAHDFIFKPLREMEVQARLNLRRRQLEQQLSSESIHYGDLCLNYNHRRLDGDLGSAHLSLREQNILLELIYARGAVVPRSVLKGKCWSGVTVSDNAVDRKIHEVRQAIRSVSSRYEVKSVYGKGITLRPKTFLEEQLLHRDRKIMLENHYKEVQP